MSLMDAYDFEDVDAFDDFDGLDDFDDFDDFDDEEADHALAGMGIGAAIGNVLGDWIGGKTHAAAVRALGKRVGASVDTKEKYIRQLDDKRRQEGKAPLVRTGSPFTLTERAYRTLRDPRAANVAKIAGSGLGSALGAAAGTAIPVFEDADPYEPEYSEEDIDAMEAFAEEAVEAEGEDAVIAADEMVSRSFGVMRAAARMRPVIAAVAARVRQLTLRAKRDPRYRTLARIAPLALRRTASSLMRMAAAGRPVTPRLALSIFGRVLWRLARQPRTRAAALRQAQVRARRHRMRRGVPAPIAARRPVAATPGAMRRRRLPYV